MKRALPALVAAAVALLLYAPSLGFDYLHSFDDAEFLAPAFVRERSLETFLELLAHPVYGSWHPLHVASYGLEAALLGNRPFTHHLGNVLCYGALVALVVPWVRSTGRSPRAALVAGLFFAVYPAHAANVAWISARKDLLSAALGLGALVLYERRRLALALALFALALLAKSVAATLVLVLVAGRALEGRLDRRELARVAPFALLGAVALAIHARAQASLGAVPPVASWLGQERLAARALERYLVLGALPLELVPQHPFPRLEPARDAVAALVVVAALATLAVGARCRAAWAFPAATFLVTLLPVANLVPFPAFVEDRYLLLPSLGVAILAGDAFEAIGRRRLALATAVAAVVLGVFAARSLAYEMAWRSDDALWTYAVQQQPDDPDALESAGDAALRAGDEERGVALLERALAHGPGRYRANVLLGLRTWSRGRLAEARARFEAAGRGFANVRGHALALAALVAIAQDDLASARELLAAAAEAHALPGEVDATLARLALLEGRGGDALGLYDRALARDPSSGAVRLGRAAALRALARREEARDELLRAAARRAPAFELAALEAHVALDGGDRDGARRVLARVPDESALIARARLAALEGDAATARALVANAIAALGSGTRREALLEPDLAPLLR